MSFLAFLFLVCLTSQCVLCCQNPPLGQLSDYNTVIFGDFKGVSSVIEGSFAASGNVHFAYSSLGSGLPCDSSSPTDNVVIGGSFLMENGGTVFGNLVYGSSASGVTYQCGGQSIQRNSSTLFHSLLDQAVETSNYLLELNPTGTPQKVGFGLVLDLSDGLEVNVFSSRAFVAQGLGNLRIIGGSPNQTVIINVPDISFINLLNVFWDFGDVPATNVIFNFPMGVSISASSLKGTILAPKATLMNYASGDFEGQLIVKSFTGQSASRIHQSLFNGCIPEPNPTTMSSSGTTGPLLGARTTGTSGMVFSSSSSTGVTNGTSTIGTTGMGRTRAGSSGTTSILGGSSTGSSGSTTSQGTLGFGLPCPEDVMPEVPEGCRCSQSGTKCSCTCDCCP